MIWPGCGGGEDMRSRGVLHGYRGSQGHQQSSWGPGWIPGVSGAPTDLIGSWMDTGGLRGTNRSHGVLDGYRGSQGHQQISWGPGWIPGVSGAPTVLIIE